jgi:PAS domain S-box-containing protein
MISVLIVSLLLRVAALGWSLVVWWRVKDWRVWFLTFFAAILTARAALTLLGGPSAWPITGAAIVNEIPALLVGIGALMTVIFVGRAISESVHSARDLAAANAELRQQVAARETAQHKLAENERMLATLMKNLPGMVYRCRNDKDWSMVFCSEGCRALTGYEPADFIGNKKLAYASIIHPDDQDMVWRDVQAALEELRPYQLTYRIRTAGGEEKWVWEQGCRVSAEREPYLEGFVTDITERKVVEDQLRQAQKMEVVGQLTGGVAHDFNNLLAIIIGNLELAGETAEAGTGRHDHISRALGAAERGATLTRQLLAFSRKQVLQPQLVDLNKLVPRAVELLHRALGETVEIETVLAGGLWKTMVDPGQLEHALLNLAVNARDAMPSGGRLTVETGNARLDEEYKQLNRFAQPGPYVMLAVSDTGCGMSPDVAARAFEPFFTTKEVGKGSGLGLSMVYGFVKQSGGHVKIYSEVGRGTTVKLYFPRARDQATPAIERPVGMAAVGGRTILVVEDDPDVRRLSSEALSEIGYRVAEAGDGPTALAILKDSAEIDLLFTDLVLPGGMDGIALAEQARAMCPKIKILYTTGYSYNAAKRHNGFDEGTDVLAKPYRKTELIRKVREILGHDQENGK